MYSVFRFIGRILFISLFFPITLIAQKAAGTTQPYRVKAGETMLGIANRHGTTLSHLLQLNPGMNPDYVQKDQVIRVPATAPTPQATKPQAGAAKAQAGAVKAQAGAAKAQAGAAKAQAGAAKAQPVAARQVKQQPIIQYKEHKVKRKETLYSIARTYDITVDELLQANPQVEKVDGKLKKGTILRIPVKIIPPQPAYVGLDTIRVAVVLPFSGKGVENERSVEFYRGMLLGIDQLKQTGTNFVVSAYNEPAPEKSIAALAAQVMQTKPHVVVGPLYPSHFTDLTAYSSKQTKVAIPFSSKVPQVAYRPDLFLLNTPVGYESTLSTELVKANFKKDVCMVFLNKVNGNKQEFCAELQQSLTEGGYKVLQLPASSTPTQLQASLAGKGPYLFIPNDTDESLLKQTLSTISQLNTLCPQTAFSLLGYDKWLSLSETVLKNQMHAVDTYIITPNYYFPYTKAAMDFHALYQHWFKTELLDCQPKMAPLGYDFSIGFLGNMATYGLDFGTQRPQEGSVAAQPKLQTNMVFMPAAKGGGYVSRSLWLVRFKPDMSIVKISAN